MSKHIIWYRYKDGPAEEIDEADSEEEAQKLVAEYKLAYPAECSVWSTP